MATYKDLVGTAIRNNEGNIPTAETGQVFFDSTNVDFKYQFPVTLSSWRTSNNFSSPASSGRGDGAQGTQDAALAAGYFDAYYGQALKARSLITKDFENKFQDVDYLISPTTPTPAFKFGEKTENPLEMYMSELCTIPANLAGLPAISIPTGLSSEGMPLSVQIMSPAKTDKSILDFSEKIEKLVGFTLKPTLLEDSK